MKIWDRVLKASNLRGMSQTAGVVEKDFYNVGSGVSERGVVHEIEE